MILIGEHAVVYGQPALIAAVGLRLTTRLEPLDSPAHDAEATVELHARELGETVLTRWPHVIDYADRARRRWEQYARTPDVASFAEVRGHDPAHLVKVALGEAARFLGETDGPPLKLHLRSDLPIGSGFGSSAALAVTVLAAYLTARGRSPSVADLERLALDVERRQHGMPSGVDGATVLHGGVVWAERDAPDAPLSITPLDLRSPHLSRFRIYDTGTPDQSTGEVVAAVRQRVTAERARYDTILDRMGECARAFRRELAGESDDPPALLELIRAYQADLEALGVVPPAVRDLVRDVETAGGAAKISGAGALASPESGDLPGAGSLLVYHPDPSRVDTVPSLERFPRHAVPLGAPGYRVESPS